MTGEGQIALHSLCVSRASKHRTKRFGRGRASGHGKTCGRGHKGDFSRKGSVRRKRFEGGQMPLIRRIPKRGFNRAFGRVLAEVNVGKLSVFEDGSVVTSELLMASGLAKGKIDGVKVLGGGDLKKRLTVKVEAMSGAARAKIEAAGGVCELVGG